MPVIGRKPKPDGQKRNRMKPVHEWTDVPNVPFDSGPPLPRSPAKPPVLEPPEPKRPLGGPGQDLWDRAWRMASVPPDSEQLLQLCEQVDERQSLRVRVLRDGDWRDRNGLRQLDAQVHAGLTKLANDQDDRPASWPAATKRWWRAVSRLPHCTMWTEADWQFALDTAYLVAAFHIGNHRLAMEIRVRERIMGTTADARRDLRIRYVDATPPEAKDDPSVTAIADYRRSVQA
jgi:hypothetical protein